MTQKDFDKLRNRSVFEYNYHWHDEGKNKKTQLLLNPTILSKTNVSIANLMDDIIDYLKPFDEEIEFMCFYESSGHTSNSQHYKGLACDFHYINSKRSYYEQIMLIHDYITKVKYNDNGSPIGETLGFGYYPGSHSKSLHLDTRGKKSRWLGIFKYYYDQSKKRECFNIEYRSGEKNYLEGLENLKKEADK